MDAPSFDRWTAKIVHPSTRRGALHLLVAGLLGGLFAPRGATQTRARQRLDRDGDGLFDDDETDVYGTNPDVFDTDGDGTGDGEEIYNRDNGLGGPSDPLTPHGGAPPPPDNGDFCPDCGLQDELPGGDFYDQCAIQGLTECPTATGGFCTNTLNDPNNCGTCGSVCLATDRGCCGGACIYTAADPYNCGFCGNVCADSEFCNNGACESKAEGPLTPTWLEEGSFCGSHSECCSGNCGGGVAGICL